MAKSISRLIILLPASKKQERGEQVQWNNGVLECWRSESHYSITPLRLSQAIQSSQQKRSRSSANCQMNHSNENPYRAGQCFAGPPNSAAQVLSSCSKSCAIRERTLADKKGLSFATLLLLSALSRPLGLSGSAPRK